MNKQCGQRERREERDGGRETVYARHEFFGEGAKVFVCMSLNFKVFESE